jgi:signal transduction histidine kinase
MVISVLQIAVAIEFVGLGVVTLAQWLIHRDARRGYMALALFSLGMVALLGRLGRSEWISVLTIVGFQLSAYGLLAFRGCFVPLRRAWRLIAIAALVVTAVALLVVIALLGSLGATPSPALTALGDAFLLTWIACVGEPLVRFWLVSRGRPRVQRLRLRFLSAGYALIVTILALALAPGATGNVGLQIGEQLMAMVSVPLLYLSVAPPRWIRNLWRRGGPHPVGRAPHEAVYREAFMEILAGTSDRATVARRSLEALAALMGCDQAVLLDADGGILASVGLDADGIADLIAEQLPSSQAAQPVQEDHDRVAIIEDLPLAGTGTGRLLMVPGPFTPYFGLLELKRLRQYGISLTAALDREQLVEGIRQRSTELEQQAAELVAARDAAEAANEAKSDFLSRVSHELRTPLTAILGFAELAQYDKTLSAEQTSRLDAILRAGEHLLSLVNDVLDLASAERGGVRMSLEPVQIKSVLTEALDLVRPIADRARISLPDEPPPTADYVRADGQRLKQVAINLLSNAVKYNRPDGSVTLGVTARDGHVRVDIKDTGVGIDPDMLPRLFMPFERAGAERTTISGTGLGLALSKSLIESMGGSVGVESIPDVGSRFWFELPADGSVIDAHEAANADGAPRTAASYSRTHSVLYVEDMVSNIRVIEGVVALRPSIRLIPVMLGELAVEMAREHRPGLILLDLHLPDLSGDEVLRRLRADESTAGIPVVILSADATDRQMRRLIDLGAHTYLTKPLKVVRLLGVLDEFFGERS